MPLRLYVDECVDSRIVAGLRRRGLDVVTASEERLLSASDPEQMERATTLERPLVTADQDFLVITANRQARGIPFPGLFFILQRTPVGDAVRAIASVAEKLDQEEMVNWVQWIP